MANLDNTHISSKQTALPLLRYRVHPINLLRFGLQYTRMTHRYNGGWTRRHEPHVNAVHERECDPPPNGSDKKRLLRRPESERDLLCWLRHLTMSIIKICVKRRALHIELRYVRLWSCEAFQCAPILVFLLVPGRQCISSGETQTSSPLSLTEAE